MLVTATTTAWGDGDLLDVALSRIAACDPDVEVVELSIGARAVDDPIGLLHSWASRFRFVAHHTAPVLPGRSVRPDLLTDPESVASALSEVGIRSYSGHPPSRRHCDEDGFWAWAHRWWETLGQAGVTWSVETMYVPRTRDEQQSSGGYHLSTPAEVWAFCARAAAVGWHDPLLIDVSHLLIGWSGGSWSERDILELLSDAPSKELHVSTNDGRRDIHQPLSFDDRAWSWVAPHLDRFDLVVDEGRRRGGRGPAHVAL